MRTVALVVLDLTAYEVGNALLRGRATDAPVDLVDDRRARAYVGAVPGRRVIASTRDPDGRLVQLDARAWDQFLRSTLR